MSRRILVSLVPALLAYLVLPLRAEPATPLAALVSLPVKEVTVFKDGHAFVVHGGSMPTDASGNVVSPLNSAAQLRASIGSESTPPNSNSAIVNSRP